MFQKIKHNSKNFDKKISSILRTSIFCDFHGFQTYFQPVYDVKKQCITGAEALMRFQCKEYGSVPPSSFIPLLEKTGLIIPAGQWILHQALSFCQEVQKYIPDFKISINLSPVQFSQGNISIEIINALEKYHIKTHSVISELTENCSLETDTHCSNTLHTLKKAGISLALDDFGTGYSNFRYISDLSPNIIKIDHSFTQKALENPKNYQLLSLFCDMLHKLNLEICIEGIENQNEMYKICQMNPDYIQGFYLGHPCPKMQFMEHFILHTSAHREAFFIS